MNPAYLEIGLGRLALSALLVVLVIGLSLALRLGLGRRLVVASLRMCIQLLLIGLVLEWVFSRRDARLVLAMALAMTGIAGVAAVRRTRRRFPGIFWHSLVSVLASSFLVTGAAVTGVLEVEPWFDPQYLIPLLGMLLGNTMSGMAIALDNLTRDAWQQRGVIEAQLMLGESWDRAIGEIRRNALRSGLIPIINAMAAAGVVSLPGMMTGQILSGSPPLEAAKYQIMILLLIAVGTGLGAIVSVWIGSWRLFDQRQRLRLERLK
jgi:putative ABC transport system permease protein